MELNSLLALGIENGATDIHITVGSPPVFRVNGRMTPVEHEALSKKETEELLLNIMTAPQKKIFESIQAVDLAYTLDREGQTSRFRANIYRQKGCVAAAFRRLAAHIPCLKELNLPETLYNLCDMPDGMILVTGPTGSGKTSTLAALINRINQTRHSHIITIEDPVEYLFQHEKIPGKPKGALQ